MVGNVHTYKARLVAKGYTKTYEIDYEETFSHVANIRAIRILIAIEAFYDYEIWQMDIKTAILNGYLNKDIYMVQHKGFIDPKHARKHGNIPIQERLDLNETKGALIPEEVKHMQNVPYALAVGSICAIDWKSSKQSTTVMFAIVAKYIDALEAAMEAIWIRKSISKLGIVPTINNPIKMLCDN
ncbi:retrotransposon protein, putative, ty1-copia subclass [Tanacetum coccineum]|uniref:Retrotransposon protein, putative, ty1-copia subclass n=1 Tax=Tanacetum coccineum TaxID=301880 RepID=A0ABQ5G544_9ASTR